MAASCMKTKESSSFIKSSTQFLLSASVSRTSSNKCCNTKAGRFELVDYDSLPEFLKDNEFIINYYRSEWPLKQTILSIFSIHNETLNIWTHLIGFFIFLMLAGYAASVFPSVSTANPLPQLRTETNSPNTIFIYRANQTTELSASPSSQLIGSPVSHWPFYLYLAGAMFCLLMSSACHLLSCHSSRTNYIMLRLDFAGISGLIVSSFYPLVYYTFACNPFFRDLYLTSITFFGLSTAAVSLMPVFDSPQFRPVRSALFACMAAAGVVPIVHKMVVFGDRPEAVLTTGYEAVMGMFYGVGVVLYVARVPERWLPGKFDLAGHSHQVFHVLVVAGAYTHYLASLVYFGWRQAEGC
ncbi:heptahelical transmembrane protein 4-like [Phalaenopsis equestris]|uniref:heptahelical transmembrane protein 4-like n=1 Tax=Phalaenopsis equestris TaxID=78828 RepID=UPI0009E3395F|nr:heptahelical transmembrane protein 4-like [Phalaenopsis equestris]